MTEQASVSSQKKNKCSKCSKRKCMRTLCKYCSESFCFNCLQQEVHGCNGIRVMIEEKQTLLKSKLEAERCVKRKIECI